METAKTPEKKALSKESQSVPGLKWTDLFHMISPRCEHRGSRLRVLVQWASAVSVVRHVHIGPELAWRAIVDTSP
jgi:hypothetical protein